MAAEQIIALEAALRDLSDLYSTARGFTVLQPRADTELLPQLTVLGSRLRSLVRTQQLDDTVIDRSATELLALASLWRSELEGLRSAPIYGQAVQAVADNRQADLAKVIPQVFARMSVVRPAPTLYFPVSPSTGRRRPGSSPFLSPAACADKILRLLAGGLEPDPEAVDWWDRELPSIMCADTPAGLDVPIALHLAAAAVQVTVFAESDAATLRVFTTHLDAPFSVVLARDATDEWWEAYQDSYRAFRDALERELSARGQTVAIIDTDVPAVNG